jgi:uncharacterized protein (DUF1697 family)
MTRQIALLRGINVGGHNRVAMADLRALLGGAGYGDVVTLGVSGNVVLSTKTTPEHLAPELEDRIAQGLGLRPRVLVRTREELAAVVAHDPLGVLAAEEPKRYQVNFLSAEPDPHALDAIAAIDLAPERWVHRGREIYAWHPVGVHNSPLAKLLTEKRLGVAVTARNWNTVTKLLALAGAESS